MLPLIGIVGAVGIGIIAGEYIILGGQWAQVTDWARSTVEKFVNQWIRWKGE